MGGPIVRTGTTPEYWENWDRVFGGEQKSEGGRKKSAPKSAKKKSAKKKSVKKVAKKKAAKKK